MIAQQIRCQNDLELSKKLLEHPEVIQVKNKMARMEGNKPMGLRRRLLSSSVRLSRTMAPDVHRIADECIETLGMKIPLELYVFASPQFNAMCFKPEDGRLFVMFASSLLESFARKELCFVMGHELGHHLFAHHDIPIGYLIKGKNKVDARLALQLFSWSRYAEISADRAGALCTTDGDAAARALFKLASGLTSNLIDIRIDDFAAQADEMALKDEPGKNNDGSNEEDWFLTHPFTPLRVKALQRFFQSELILEGGNSREQLESESHQLMQMMAPTYLEEDSESAEMMRRVLFAAGCVLMKVSGTIDDREIEAFNALFGEGTFGDHLDIDKLEERLSKRIEDAVAKVPRARRIHIIRDLCLIAAADGRVTRKEREFVHGVGKQLKLSPTIIDHSFDRDVELD